MRFHPALALLCLPVALFAACGSGDDASGGAGGAGPSAGGNGSPLGGASSGLGGFGASAGATAGGSGGSATSGHPFPYKLSPLTAPLTQTANISLYFSVQDASGAGVADLGKSDFVALEDGQPVDPLESAFDAAPLDGNTLDIPTVLLLDLSGSIVAGGALDTLKAAAGTLVDGILPTQRMALVTFADTPTERLDFTTDKTKLHQAIDALADSDGASTNLYGSLVYSLGLWGSDGFQGGTTAKLTTGLVVVITDGSDTAGVSTLPQVIAARQEKRIVTVGIGPSVNTQALQQIGNAAFIQTQSYDTLKNDVGKVTSAMQTLNSSIYQANYCSPKRAGTHQLSFTVKGNEGTKPTATCTAASVTSQLVQECKSEFGADSAACGVDLESGKFSCCTVAQPYSCNGKCYATPDAAVAACGTCTACTQVPTSTGGCDGTGDPGCLPGGGATSGTSIDVPFNATSYVTGQCPQFWKQNCKDLDACCDTLAADFATQCEQSLQSAVGDETQCQTQKQHYCPVFGPSCTAAKACCATLPGYVATQCQEQLANVDADETECQSLISAIYCPTFGTRCTQLKTCCDAFGHDEGATCYQQGLGIGDGPTGSDDREQSCDSELQQFCVVTADCKTLAAYCAGLADGAGGGSSARGQCESALVGARNDGSQCTEILSKLKANGASPGNGGT